MAFMLGFDAEHLIETQGERIMADIHQAVLDITKAAEKFKQAVLDELARVAKELADIRAPGGGADAQALEDLAASLDDATKNVASFEVPAPTPTPVPNPTPAGTTAAPTGDGSAAPTV